MLNLGEQNFDLLLLYLVCYIHLCMNEYHLEVTLAPLYLYSILINLQSWLKSIVKNTRKHINTKRWKCFWCTWILSKGKVLFVLLSRYFQSRIIVIVILIRNELQYRLNVCIGWSVMNLQLLTDYFWSVHSIGTQKNVIIDCVYKIRLPLLVW